MSAMNAQDFASRARDRPTAESPDAAARGDKGNPCAPLRTKAADKLFYLQMLRQPAGDRNCRARAHRRVGCRRLASRRRPTLILSGQIRAYIWVGDVYLPLAITPKTTTDP